VTSAGFNITIDRSCARDDLLN